MKKPSGADLRRRRRTIVRDLGDHRRWEVLANYEGPETGRARVSAAFERHYWRRLVDAVKSQPPIMETAFTEPLFPNLQGDENS